MRFFPIGVGTLAILLALAPLREATAQSRVGFVLSLQGDADVTRGDTERTLGEGDEVFHGDRVAVGTGGKIRVQMNDNVLQLGSNAEATLRAARGRDLGTKVRLWIGRLWARVATGSRFAVETENAVAGVRGTSFFVARGPAGELDLTVYQGKVSLRHISTGAERLVQAGARVAVDTKGGFESSPPSEPDALADVQTSQRRRETPDTEKVEQARDAVARMQEILSLILENLKRAREEKDIVKLNCVNEKLTAVKGLLNIAERASVDLRESLARRDTEAAGHHYEKALFAREKAEQLFNESEACVGEFAVYSGDTEVEVEVDENVTAGDDPERVPPGVELITRPPAGSPYQ